MPTAKSRRRSLLRTFARFTFATFFLGGAIWMWSDLRQFDPITFFVALQSVAIWVAVGWIPSVGAGGLVVGWEVVLGRHPRAQRRYGMIVMGIAFAMTSMWVRSMEIPVDSGEIRVDAAMYSRNIREEGERAEPGDVAGYLDEYYAPRSRYVALRTLQDRRAELRVGERWADGDLAALELAASESLQSSYKPLKRLALDTLIWAKLEGLEPGEMGALLHNERIPAAAVAEWLTDWEKPGRPRLESQLAQEDLAAIQDWAASKMPDGLPALRWSLEQSGEGAVGAFLARERSDADLAEVLRSWCTSQGWSPLLDPPGPTAADRSALDDALSRLGMAKDPVLRREAQVHRKWVDRTLRPVRTSP